MNEPHLEFCIEDKLVGHFLGGGGPSHPGRYRYEPYRGEGHALLVSMLQKGEVVMCTFVHGDAEFRVTIEQEVFVPATPESYWFVDIAAIDQTKGTPNNSVQRTGAGRSALLPIRTLSAAGSHR